MMLLLLSALAMADGPPKYAASDEMRARVKARMDDAYGVDCMTHTEEMTSFGLGQIRVYPAFGKDSPQLVQVPCALGAYNLVYIHFLLRPNGDLEELQFAVPTYRFHTEAKGSVKYTVVDEVQGFGTVRALVNAVYDPETFTIQSHSKGRGVGDVYSRGRWRWNSDHNFVLEHFEADESMDGKITPTVIYSRDRADKSAVETK
ncbi:MAG: DUF1176 domain-containing protein [Myxococcota bacterium]